MDDPAHVSTFSTELGRRMREVRARESRADSAARFGIHPNSLAKYEEGKRLPDAFLVVKFARSYGVHPGWLLTGEGQRDRKDALAFARGAGRNYEGPATDWHREGPIAEAYETKMDGSVLIPVYGQGSETALYSVRFSREWIAERGVMPIKAELVIAAGDRMAPTIVDGDMLLVERGCEAAVDGIYAIRRNSARAVSRLQWHSDGTLSLLSDNPAYETERLPRDLADTLQVAGRVGVVFRTV